MTSLPMDAVPVVGALGYYVTSRGEVFSSLPGRRPRQLFGHPLPSGYVMVTISGAKRYVHEMVLSAFRGPRPEGWQSRHLDGSCQNNRLENLAWGTALENIADKRQHGTQTYGEAHSVARLSDAQVDAIRGLYRSGVSQAVISRRFGLSSGYVSALVRNRKRVQERDDRMEALAGQEP